MKTGLNHKRALLVFTSLFISGGLALIIYYFYSAGMYDSGLPYKYVLLDSGSPSKFPELKINGDDNLMIRKYETRVIGVEKPVAKFFTAELKGSPRVVIDHQSDSPIPIAMLPVNNEAYQALYKEILENTKEDELFLAWWDNSLRIRLFTGRPVLLTDFIGKPVFVPDSWKQNKKAIERFEEKFWNSAGSKEQEEIFRKYTEAMLSDEDNGYKALKDLSKGKKAYLMIDIKDLLSLSEYSGGKFIVEYKEFAMTGDIHATAKQVKIWLKDMSIKDYTIEPASESVVRIYYLKKPEDKDRLLVKLLPFTSSNPFNLEKFKLRYQNSNIYVYEII